MSDYYSNLDEVAWIQKIQKLVSKVKKYTKTLEDKKMIDVMLEIKTEVEGYTGHKINMEKHIDEIEREAKKKGAKFKSGEIKELKKRLKAKEKSHDHHLQRMSIHYTDLNQGDDNFIELLESSHKTKGKDEKEDKTIEVGIRVTIGVTASLCGLFLSFIPHPTAQLASKFLVSSGVALCVDGTINELEKEEERQKQQQRHHNRDRSYE